MIRMAVLTPWKGDGTEDSPNRPAICDDYAVNYTDITGTPTAKLYDSPNLLLAGVLCSDDTAEKIEQDQNYFVVWSEEI